MTLSELLWYLVIIFRSTEFRTLLPSKEEVNNLIPGSH